MIVEEFGNLTVADVNLIFRRAKLGKYGSFYGRLDGQMLLTWFGEYFDERIKICALKSENEAAAYKGDFMKNSTDETRRLRMEVDKLTNTAR